MMELTIRKTNKSEFFQTENLTREAFWNLYQSGSSEHLVLHNLRKSINYVHELDLVIINDGQILGHIILSKAKIVNDKDEHEVLCVGPFAVLSEFQNKGIGSKLISHSIKQVKILGFNGIILFGNPAYYQRFGFKNAKEYGISTKDGQNFDPFMALELRENGLANIQGRFFDDEAFEIDEDELEEFEKRFPAKKKGEPKIRILQ